MMSFLKPNPNPAKLRKYKNYMHKDVHFKIVYKSLTSDATREQINISCGNIT